jgi:hypothetical protein
MLVAAVIRLESALNDATLFMFDKLLGSMSRKAERQTAEKSFQTLREVQVHREPRRISRVFLKTP